MIAQAGLDQQSRQKMGLGLSNSEISRDITSNPQLQDEHGQFDRARFEMLLHDMGMTEQSFLASQRQNVLRRQLVDTVSGDITLPQAWLDAINQFQNQERSIQYVSLGPAQAGDIPQPTDEQLSKYFDDRKILFRAPEYRKIDTVTVTPAALAQWMQVSDDDIKKAYDEQHASFVTPEKRHVEQIVFPQMADAQAAADRIKSGTSFADIAKERGLKPQDIDLGTVAKASHGRSESGRCRLLAQGGRGQRAGRRRSSARCWSPCSRSSRRRPSRSPRRRRSCATRSRSIAPRSRSRICTTRSKTIAPAAARSKRRRRKRSCRSSTFDVDRSGRDPDGKLAVNLPHGADIVSGAFASDVGVDNDPIDVDGGYIWYDVAAITPARDRTLDEVKGPVTQRWRDDEIASRLKSQSGRSARQAQERQPVRHARRRPTISRSETASDLKRGGSSGDISPNMTQAIFHTAKDAFGSSVGANPTQWIVFQVTDIKTPKLDANSADAKHIEETLHNQMSDDLIGQYVGWLENDLGTTVNPSVLAQAMGNGTPDTN